MSAALADDAVMAVFHPGDHGSTFGGNPLGCAVAKAALEVIRDERLVENSETMGAYLQEQLATLPMEDIAEICGKRQYVVLTGASVAGISPEDGSVLWKAERSEEALDAFTTILEEDPDDLEALYNRGELLLELGRIGEAVEVFEAYLQSQPESADAYMHLADAYRIEERYDRALEAYDQVIVYDETRAEAWFYSAVIQLTKIEDPDL